MNRNMNDRVKVKGTISRAAAEAMRRGEIESNNGLRKSHGRRSWNPEQPVFELDDGPGLGEQIGQFLMIVGCETLITLAVEDWIPAGRYLFRTEVVPAIKWKMHRKTLERQKAAEKKDVEETEPVAKDAEATSPQADNVIHFNQYYKAANR